MIILNKKRITGFLATASIAAAGVMMTPQTSHAEWTRVHPLSCQSTFSEGTMFGGIGGAFHVYDDIVQLSCPLQDDTALHKEDIDAIEVFTHDGSSAGNNFTRVFACGIDRESFDGACLLGQSAGGSGFNTLVLSTSQELGWLQSVHRAPYYASLHVYIRSDSAYSSSGQSFHGYTMHD